MNSLRPVLCFNGICRLCVRLSRLARTLSLGTLSLCETEKLTSDERATLGSDWTGELALIYLNGRNTTGTKAVFYALPGVILRLWANAVRHRILSSVFPNKKRPSR